MSEPTLRLRDNPILIAQARRRMRRKQALPTIAIAVVLGICGILGGSVTNDPGAWSGVANFGLVLVAALLLLRGTTQVAGTVVDERSSGILDFHRATPTTPWTDALGYLVGPVTREYVVVAALLPFILFAAVAAGTNPVTVLLEVVVLAVGGVVLQSMALVMALAGGGRRSVSGTVMVVAMALLFGAVPLYGAGFVTVAFLTPIPALASLIADDTFGRHMLGSVDFYGIPVHPLIWTAVVQGIAIGFLLWASARKLRREAAPAFSRPGAFLFFAIVTVLLIGGSWTSVSRGLTEVASGVALAALTAVAYLVAAPSLAVLLMMSLAPTYADTVRVTRRARRAGREAPSWLEDGAPGLPVVATLAAQVVAGWALLSIALSRHVPMASLWGPSALLALGAAVMMVAFIGGSIESLRLTMRSSYKAGLLLTGFLAFVLPWILMGIVAGASKDPDLAQAVAALSPLFGAGAAAIQLGMDLTGEHGEINQAAVAFSVLFAVAVTAWFFFRAGAVRRALAARVPLGTGTHD